MEVWFIFWTSTRDQPELELELLLISLSRLAVTMASIWSSMSPATMRLMLEVDSRSWLVIIPPPQPRSRASIEGCWAMLESRSISKPGGPVTRSLVVTTSWDGDAMVFDGLNLSVGRECTRDLVVNGRRRMVLMVMTRCSCRIRMS